MRQPSALSSFEGICCCVGFDCHWNVRVKEPTDGNGNRGVFGQWYIRRATHPDKVETVTSKHGDSVGTTALLLSTRWISRASAEPAVIAASHSACLGRQAHRSFSAAARSLAPIINLKALFPLRLASGETASIFLPLPSSAFFSLFVFPQQKEKHTWQNGSMDR